MATIHATREEHPVTAVVLHWLHLVSIFVLIYTGFFIHNPFGPGTMDFMRGAHFTFMYILIIVAIVRVLWAFLGEGSAASGERKPIKDYRHFGYQRENRGQFGETLKYYLFLRRTHPHGAKYNPLQKITYMLWLLLIILQAITGFALYPATAGAFEGLVYAIGGVMVMRSIHFIIMWLFIVTTAVHVYLSTAEAPWQLQLMFFRREPDSDADARVRA